jgi:hypothetical protein
MDKMPLLTVIFYSFPLKLICILSVALCSGAAVAFSSNNPIFGEENYPKATPILKDNSHLSSSSFLTPAQLKGYKKLSELPDGASRIQEELIPWNKSETLGDQKIEHYSISPERMIWIVKTNYPEYTTRHGLVTDAEVIELWDAETGEFYGVQIKGKVGASEISRSEA